MPERPEVEALAHHLREHALYRPVARVDVASMSAVKTYDPPVSALRSRVVTGASRYGKFLAVEFLDRPDDPLHLITHLSRAGWLRWHDTASTTPPKPGKGPLSLRVHLDDVGGPGFDLTEAGTQKRLSVYLVADPQEVPGVARLGPDALAVSRDELAELLDGRTERIKNLITDQTVVAGIGNAYSDEILHTARLSPYAVSGRLDRDKVDVLYQAIRGVLSDAVARSVWAALHAYAELRHLRVLLSLHLHELPHALLRVRARVHDRRVALERPVEDAEDVDAAREGVGERLEDERGGLRAVDVDPRGQAFLGRRGNALHDEIEQRRRAEVLRRDRAGDREDLAARDRDLERRGDLLRRELLALEVALHQRLVRLDDRVEELLAVLVDDVRQLRGDLDRA